jgi:NTE family protein
VSKIGFCLAGGGARGPYQVGVAKALEELGYWEKISAFSGTSIGAVNSAFLSSLGVQKTEELWHGISDDDIKTTEGTFKRIIKEGRNIAETGLYNISALSGYMSDNLDFERFKEKEVYVTLSEGGNANESIFGLIKSSYAHFIKNNSKVIYARLGNQPKEKIIDLIVASCSIPLIFPPVTIQKKKYYDGGVYDNVPIEPLAQCGCDTIIVAHLHLLDFIDKAKYPGINILEIKHTGSLGGLLNFSPTRVASLVELGYQDTLNFFNKCSI